jgi:branched-chain amino acid transport system permease protein
VESAGVKTAAEDTATVEGATAEDGATKRPLRGGLSRDPRSYVRALVIAGVLLFVLLAFPSMFSQYYVDAWTQVAIYSIVALGLGLLVGRVGMVSLGQGAVLAMGAWVAARLLFATALPYPIVLLGAGLITMVLGTLVGLPALRMSGLYLALITLMLAGAITVTLSNINFPNGGHGFTGYNGASVHISAIRRPSIAGTDPAFFRYALVVAVIMFLLVLVHLRGKPGRAWAAIRQSESAALAAGINTTLYKLWAFALASFITGVAGGLVAGSYRYLNALTFSTQDSITLLAVVLMGGAYSIWGAIVAAILLKFLQALLNDWGVSPDWLTILFGIGVLQVLTTAPAGLVDQVPRDIKRLGRLLFGIGRRGQVASAGPPAGPSGGSEGEP